MKGLLHPFSGQTWGLSPLCIRSITSYQQLCRCRPSGVLTMTSKITPSCKTFTTSRTCKSFHTSNAVLPRTAGVVRTGSTLAFVLLLLLHVYILEGSLPVRCWQHWHLLLQLGGRFIAQALRYVVLKLSLGGSGNSSRALSV